MSAVTLETLRADFVRLADEEWTVLELGRIRRWLLLRSIERRCHKVRVNTWSSPSDELSLAGRLYRIARRHGLNAAMLYKLSDGAIGPREAR